MSAMYAANVIHINTTPKTNGVIALAIRSSAVEMGVARSGSRVRASFSPMTACAAMAIDPTTGTIRMRRLN